MMFSGRQISLFLVIVSGLVTGCGGGGGGDSANSAVATGDANTFLVYPNPHVQDDGSYQTLSVEYAQAYYRAIDPSSSRDSLSKWKAANHFGDVTSGEEVTVVFRDVRDLGYGRRMVVRRNIDGTIAAMVDNYQVTGVPGGAYTKLNVDAAVAEDQRWHVGTNAIEFSPYPYAASATPSFVKFYTFSQSGDRKLTANMDGLGEKPLPAVCGTCHGGRGDPLSPLTGNPSLRKFPSIANGVSGKTGDIGARMQPLQVSTFEYSDLRTTRDWLRSDQESAFKTINQFVLQTYPIPLASAAPEDALRPVAGPNEWQGTAAQFVKDAYGGDNMMVANYSEPAVPTTWGGQETLYTKVVAPYCRTCHLVRGVKNQSDPDFTTYAKFTDYVKRIRFHVYDRGNMPLSKVTYDAFWSSDAPEVLAAYLEAQGETGLRDGSGVLLRPGRPVAIAGPDRASPSPAKLSAASSLYATNYTWSILSGPGAATLSNANTVSTMLSTAVLGNYRVQLVVGNGSSQSQPVAITVHVVSDLTQVDGVTPLGKSPEQLRFSDIKAIIQTSAQTNPIDLNGSPPTQCLHCHWRSLQPNGVLSPRVLPLGQNLFLPPSFFDDYDRDGSGGLPDATDDYWLYALVRGKLNMLDIEQSLLLRKPSNNPPNNGTSITTNVSPFDNHHHAFAHPIAGFNLNSWSTRASYDVILNWVLYGAQY